MKKKNLLITGLVLAVMVLAQLSLLTSLPNFLEFPIVHGSLDMVPTDGDAWTENDNSTYPWTWVSPYKDTLEFQTSEGVTSGSYALKVTNMAGTYFSFELTLPTDTDVSACDFFRFYYVTNTTVDGKYWDMKILDGTDTFRIRFYIDNSSSGCITVPLDAFGITGSPSWDSINSFQLIYGPFGDADGGTVYLDGMHFTTNPIVDSTSYDLEYDTRPFFKLTDTLEQDVYENSQWYKSIWSYANATSGESTEVESMIENEAVAHTIFALSLIYDYTKSPLVLEKLNSYGNWLYRMYSCPASNSTYYGGTVDFYNNGTQTWGDVKTIVCNGWVLMASSVLYSVTENASYKTIADSTASLLADILWDETNDWFDYSVKPSDGTITDSASWSLMSQSAGMGGLWAYSDLVEDNATIELMAQKAFDSMPTTALGYYNIYYFGASPYLETTAYYNWAKYWGFKATGNTTYQDNCQPESLMLAHVLADESGVEVASGRGPYTPFDFWRIESDVKRDDWGTSCSALLVAVKLIELSNTAYQRALERLLFNYHKDVTTSGWLFPRSPNSGDANEWKTWNGQLPFYLGAYILYLHQIAQVSTPYVLASDGEVTTQSLIGDKLTLEIERDAGTTTTTEIYCGDKGKPKYVDGADSWSFTSDTQILSLTVTHSSTAIIQVGWSTSALGVYPLTVSVLQNGMPTIATVVITGAENQTVFGLPVTFELPYGDYFILVYCGDQRQTKSIFLSGPQSVGFDFIVSESPNWAVLGWTIPVFVVVVVGLYFLFFRNKG